MKKLLVPIDGSVSSQNAAKKAIELAEKYNSLVVFINVIYESDISMYNKFGVTIDPDMKKLKEKLKREELKMMDDFISKLGCENIDIQKKSVSGEPYEQILKEADKGNYDLIIMGRRGFSKIKRFFIGSVTQRVISEAPCPVLVVKE